MSKHSPAAVRALVRSTLRSGSKDWSDFRRTMSARGVDTVETLAAVDVLMKRGAVKRVGDPGHLRISLIKGAKKRAAGRTSVKVRRLRKRLVALSNVRDHVFL